MENRTALVFGATGLIGKLLVGQLVDSSYYARIRTFPRNKADHNTDKKTEVITTDYNNLDQVKEHITGDDLFICMGTTIKKAGSVAKMEEIDRDLPLRIATIALQNGIKRIGVVSSLGASVKSSNYYLRIKGEMEKGITDLNFQTTIIARPSLLLGERNEKRAGETISKAFMKAFGGVLRGRLLRYRAIQAADVAKALIVSINTLSGINILESDKLQKLASD